MQYKIRVVVFLIFILNLFLFFESKASLKNTNIGNIQQKELVLKGNLTLSKSIVLDESVRVISRSNNPVNIKTTGNFPAFIIKGENISIEGVNFDGLNFIKIENNITALSIVNCTITDSKSSERAYMLTKDKDYLKIESLKLIRSTISNVTPIFLTNVFINSLEITNSSFKNIFRYGFRVNNDSHNGGGSSVREMVFKGNRIVGLSPGKGKKGVARLIMVSALDEVIIDGNQIKNINGVEAGGNILYWSGTASLNFSNNTIENISGNSYAIHDKGLRGNKPKVIKNNTFTQSNNKIEGLINIFQASNFLIEGNIFRNLKSPAVRISNPRPLASEAKPSNITVSKNQFVNINSPEIITVIQTVHNLNILDNIVNGLKNTNFNTSQFEVAPRLVSIVATLKEADINHVVIEGNVMDEVSEKSTLLWVSQLNNGFVTNLNLNNNTIVGGEALIRVRNQKNSIFSIRNNKLSRGVKEIIGGTQNMIKRSNEK